MARDVLVLNAGSSSIKYQLLDMAARARLAVGQVERIGGEGTGRLVHHAHAGTDAPHEVAESFADHAQALDAILEAFKAAGPDLSTVDLAAVGHRVVHGGTRFRRPTLIDDAVLSEIRELGSLAPLHNPANATGIEVARRAFPNVPHVAVFDTAFHQSCPLPRTPTPCHVPGASSTRCAATVSTARRISTSRVGPRRCSVGLLRRRT